MDNFWSNKNIECDCGKRHSFLSSVLGDDIAAALEKVKPSGTHALFAGEDEEIISMAAKRFRLSMLNDKDTKSKEDIRLVIGQGGGINHAKYIAKKMNLECVIIGSGDFLTSSIIQKPSKECFLVNTPPHHIIVSQKDNTVDLANNFAMAALSILGLFEYFIINDQKVCPLVFEKAAGITKDLISVADKTQLASSMKLKEAIIDANVRFALVNEYLYGGMSGCLSLNGAIQSAAALSQMFFHDRNERIERLPSAALVLSGAVIKAYEAFLAQKLDYCPPPDNALRIERLVDFSGMNEATAIGLMPPYLGRAELDKRDYGLEIYRDGYLRMLGEARGLLDEALHLFFKLLPCGGFEYKEYANSIEVCMSIGLGPDILKGNTLLSIMRDKGVLEGFIV